MTTLHLRPSVVRASALPNRNPSSDRQKPNSVSSPSWWTPLFGLSPEPDYIASVSSPPANQEPEPEKKAPSPSRFTGCFTAEKAKRLRMLTKNTESFHDVMYHSAIASRLASEFDDRFDSDL